MTRTLTPSSPSHPHPAHHSPPLWEPSVCSRQLRACFLVCPPFFSPFAHSLFLKCYMSKIIWYLSFPDFPYHTTLRLHPGDFKRQDFIVLWLSNIPVCVCVCVCMDIHIHTYIHIGLLFRSLICQWTLVLAIGNNAAINTGLRVSRGIRVFVFSWVVSSSAITGS